MALPTSDHCLSAWPTVRMWRSVSPSRGLSLQWSHPVSNIGRPAVTIHTTNVFNKTINRLYLNLPQSCTEDLKTAKNSELPCLAYRLPLSKQAFEYCGQQPCLQVARLAVCGCELTENHLTVWATENGLWCWRRLKPPFAYIQICSFRTSWHLCVCANWMCHAFNCMLASYKWSRMKPPYN